MTGRRPGIRTTGPPAYPSSAIFYDVGRLTLIVTGDFNAVAGDSRAYPELTRSGAFADTWEASRQLASRACGTFPDDADPLDGGGRIDWILTTPGLAVHRVGINVWTRDACYPSAHAPVQAVISLSGPQGSAPAPGPSRRRPT